MTVEVLFKGGYTPQRTFDGDAGFDLQSSHTAVIQPRCRQVVKTGIAIALPDGYAGFIMPRSGLASENGITLVNSPGVIDAGYRGEISVVLINTDLHQAFHISQGDRIAQLVIMPVCHASFIEVDTLPGSARGISAFGSSGRHDTRG